MDTTTTVTNLTAKAQSRRGVQVTLVVPLRNEQQSLQSLISSLIQQSLGPDEIILVDGGSTDLTVDVARRLTCGIDKSRVIEAGDATPGRGRNVGIENANNEWVALTDCGIELDPAWLENLVEVITNDPLVDVVYGNYEPMTNTFFERCAALAYPPPKMKRPAGQGSILMRGPSVASMLLRRSVWKSVGGFPDLRAAEDLIFMQRIEEQGFNIGWAPQATVWWSMQPTLRRTFQKFVLYSMHNVRAGWQRYWHYGIARMYLAGLPFFFLALIHNWWWLAIPLMFVMARVAKSIWIRREGRGLLWMINPLQFFGVGAILITIDLATFIGWAKAIRSWRND